MAGVYIHIPFCRKACHYCDFHFSTNLSYRSEMTAALRRELFLRKDYLEGEEVTTIYFGGGTPSLLDEGELDGLLDTVAKYHRVARDCEITLEANPDDLDEAKVPALKRTAVNRLSIGVQSFFDEDLRWMNRTHTAREALASVGRVLDAGYTNLTVDLMYGYPLLTDEKWLHNIRTFLSLDIPHLSCYNLTVEEGTALAAFIRKGREIPPDEGQGAAQFGLLMDEMEQSGFLHYEISNFCRGQAYSRHNTAYWRSKFYLGIGPSAHSFNGSSRQWNVAGNQRYLKALQRNEIPCENEQLSPDDRLNEYLMTGLRTVWGVDLLRVSADFGPAARADLERAATAYLHKGWLKKEETRLTLTRPGKLYADRIASELFRI